MASSFFVAPHSIDALRVAGLDTSAPSSAPLPAPLHRLGNNTPGTHQPSLFESFPLVAPLSYRVVETSYKKEEPRVVSFSMSMLKSVFGRLAIAAPLTADVVLNLCLLEAHLAFWHRNGRFRVVTEPDKAARRSWPMRMVRIESRDYRWTPGPTPAWDSVVSIVFHLATLLVDRQPVLFSSVTPSAIHNFCRNLMRNWALMLHARGYMALPVDGLEESFNQSDVAVQAHIQVRREWRRSTARSKAPSLLRPRWVWARTTGRRGAIASDDRADGIGQFPVLYTHAFAGALDKRVSWHVPPLKAGASVEIPDVYLLCWQASWCINGELRKYLTRGVDRANTTHPELRGCLRNRVASVRLGTRVDAASPVCEMLVHPNCTFAVHHGGLVVPAPIGDVPDSIWRGEHLIPQWRTEWRDDLPHLAGHTLRIPPRLMAMDLLARIPVPVPRAIRVLQRELEDRGVLFEELIRSVRKKLCQPEDVASLEVQSPVRAASDRPLKRPRAR